MWTRETFEELQGCQDPECTTPDCNRLLYLHASCHNDRPPWIMYDRETKSLRVECSVCRASVAEIAVGTTDA